jgi:hypothetical protein
VRRPRRSRGRLRRAQQGERVRRNWRAYAARSRQSGRTSRIAALLQELELLGWTACRNVEIDVRLGRARRPPSRITPSARSGRIRSSSAICYVTLVPRY